MYFKNFCFCFPLGLLIKLVIRAGLEPMQPHWDPRHGV